MGNEESKNRRSEETRSNTSEFRPQFSDVEVQQLLELQKQHFDKKIEQITKKTQPQSHNAATAGSSGVPRDLPIPRPTVKYPQRVNTLNSPTTSGVVRPSPATLQSAAATAGSSGVPRDLRGPLPTVKDPQRVNSPTTSSVFGSTTSTATLQGATATFATSAVPRDLRGPLPTVKDPQRVNSPTTSRVFGPTTSTATLERPRAPYNYNQVQLNQATTSPTLYPNLSKVQPAQFNHPLSSDFVVVNNTGNVERVAPSAPPAPRERSTSRPRFARERNEGVEDEVKCPTCKNIYGLNSIFQCPRGHSSCAECKRSNRVCGICRQRITDMRNITMESVIAEMKVNCPNTNDGCHLSMKMADIEKHAKECPFGEIPCPVKSLFGCMWKGKLSQIESHFDDVHPLARQGAVNNEMTHINLKHNYHIPYLIVLGAFHFMFHLVISQSKQKVYMAVQLLGTNKSASKWTYDIHVYHKGQPRRKYQYIDVCQSTNTNINDIMSESKCAVLPLSYASTFLSDNKFTYKFYIKKEVNEKPFGKNNRGRGGFRK